MFGKSCKKQKKKERTLWVRPRHLLGEQRETAPVGLFLEAKSSTQGVEGEGYAPTRNDYVAGQGGFRSHSFRYTVFASVSSRGRITVAFPSGGRLPRRGLFCSVSQRFPLCHRE